MEQQVLERSTGILLIRELPDTVRMKETEAEAYSAVWDLMLELEKNLPMAYIFYGQDSFVEHNEHFDERFSFPVYICPTGADTMQES